MVIMLANVRKKKGFTQQDLAAMTGINQRVISRFEVGTTIPRLDQLVKLMTALGASWDEMVEL